MNIGGKPYRTLWELPGADGIEVIDQRVLPHRFATAVLRTAEDVAVAIREMYVRGAPLIGAAAGYGVYFAARSAAADGVATEVDRAAGLLAAARPTAVNLQWAIRFVLDQVHRGRTADDRRRLALAAARQIVADELDRSRRIGEHGLQLIRDVAARKGEVNVLTHCNAGWLACVDYGTATAPVYAAHEAGIPVHVWVDETRPRNQGAALTAFELGEHGVRHTVVADNAGGHLMQRGMVDLAIVGADRVAANGDTANKIGTYLKALAAHDTGVPFYVALPSSTVDWSLADGAGIPIEERSADEVRYIDGLGPRGPERVRLLPESSPAANPAFDVTPARLVTAFVTEHGVFPPTELRRRVQGR
ncbi:MAG: methylthioribose-phosphate isomerase [Gemmataceae bacterium]|nr:methylthioribose-phosphate isomerase [Gemmataceae bacterium]